MSNEFTADLAVVIGIGDYKETGRLETPVHDAGEVAKLLASRFGYEVILQCDGTASLKGLRALLSQLAKKVPSGSRLLVYFAGHGIAIDSTELEGPQGYLVPQDGTSETDTHLPMRELYEALADMPCRHLLVVLDCCFAGSFRWASRRPMFIPDEMLYEERYRHWIRHPARWTLASAAHDEYALDIANRRSEQATERHSPFAAALLAGLAGEADTRPDGGDGIVTTAELYSYIQDRVTPHQSPILAPLPGQTRGEFVFRDQHRLRPLPSAERQVQLDGSHNPYKGLQPYRAEDSKLFFGREDVARRLLHQIERNPLTLVAGPSGSGKTSLVRAGLLPLLRTGNPRDPKRRWKVTSPLQITANPIATLRAALDSAGAPPLAAELRVDLEAVRIWAATWMAFHPGERLLVIFDQAEKLVSRGVANGTGQTADLPTDSATFFACLYTLLEAGAGRLQALLAVRSESLEVLRDHLASLDHESAVVVAIPDLEREELRQIIEGPYSRKALYFEDPRLVDLLADETLAMPGGLPLLSCVLDHLYLAYLRNGRGDRLLTASDLEEIDSKPATGTDNPAAEGILRVLRGAVSRAVDSLQDEAHQQTLERILLRLVHRAGGRTTRQRITLRELEYLEEPENRRVAEVLERLVDKSRLLVRNLDLSTPAGPGQSSVVTIELAHDRLIEAWPDLERRVEELSSLLLGHRRLTHAATAWILGSSSPRGKPRRRQDLDLHLLKQVETIQLPNDWLNRDEIAYLDAARIKRKRRRLQLSAAVAAILLGVLTLFATTWRPAINEFGRLELRPGPKWLAPLNVGPWRTRVETDFSSGDLVGEVYAKVQDEAGLYRWPGRNRAGLRYWIEPVLDHWLRQEVSLRWKVRLDFPQIEGELLTTQYPGGVLGMIRLETRQVVTHDSATELAAEYALLRPDLPLIEAWSSQWEQFDYGTSCLRPEPGEHSREMAELYLWDTPPNEVAAWLRGLALTARSSEQVGFDQVFDLVRRFKTSQLSWQKDVRDNPEQAGAQRPSPQEVAALAELLEAILVRRIDTGKPAVPDAIRQRLLDHLPGCSEWVMPLLASLGPLGDPAVVRARGVQGDQGLGLLRSLSEHGLLTGADLDDVLRSKGFGEDYLGSKSAVEQLEDWLEEVARNQPLPSSTVDALLQFAKASLQSGDVASSLPALKPVAWSAPQISPAQRHELLSTVRLLRPDFPILTGGEIELWGILGAHFLADPETLATVLEPVTTAADGQLEEVSFASQYREEGSQTIELHAGLGFQDLLAIARMLTGLPKIDPTYRSPTALDFLRQAAYDGLREGVPDHRLDEVFVAIADLATQLEPGGFSPDYIRRLLSESGDALERNVAVKSSQAALRRMEDHQQEQALALLRDCWQEEREPEIKYALATVILGVERARRPHEIADLRGAR